MEETLSEDILRIGYVHIDKGDTNQGLQKEILQKEGCIKIYYGRSDDIDFERPELVKAVRHAGKSDTNCLIVFNLMKLAASLENLSDICKVMKMLGISLKSIDENIFIKKFSGFEKVLSPTGSLRLSEDSVEKKTKDTKGFFPKLNRKKMIKLLICIIIILCILSGIYYWLLTKYDDEEMDDTEFNSSYKIPNDLDKIPGINNG